MTFIDHPASVNLRRLMGVRLLLLCGFALLALLVHFVAGVPLPLPALALIVAALGLVTLLTWWRLGWEGWPVRESEIAVQLGLDVAALTAVLYLTGGWSNPLVSFYLVPIAVAVVTLRPAHTWAIAAATVLCYSLLTFFHRPIAGLFGAPPAQGPLLEGFPLHLAGMWLTFVLSAALIAYFGITMAATLRERARALAAMREENLRNEQIIGVATLAAGTAHELGTPLSTVAVIASELRDEAEQEGREAARAELGLLLRQVETCKGILARLRAAAGQPRRERAPAQRVDELLEQIRERWRLLRPSQELGFSASGTTPVPRIRADTTLEQAILNLLNNAADASPDAVSCDARWDEAWLELDIGDRGAGFDADRLARIGEPVDDAGRGLGMGLMLANATVERLGGSVRMADREGGGTCVHVRLPLLPASAATPAAQEAA